MAVRPLRTIGDPVLRTRAADVDSSALTTSSFAALTRDLVDTMHAEGGIGIAAPQIGELVRAAIIEIDAASTRYPDMHAFPRTLFVNPRVTVIDPSEQGYWEGCLSVPGLRGYVWRPRGVQVDYLDEHGMAQSLVAEGFLATVIQHELDHLDGVLFVDRVRDTRRLATVENYAKYWARREDSPEL